jgi:hypothetical protein
MDNHNIKSKQITGKHRRYVTLMQRNKQTNKVIRVMIMMMMMMMMMMIIIIIIIMLYSGCESLMY